MAHRLKKYASQVSLSRLLSFVNLSSSISGAGEITLNRFFSSVMLCFTRTTRLNKRAAELPQKLFNLLYEKVVFSVVKSERFDWFFSSWSDFAIRAVYMETVRISRVFFVFES